MRVFAGADAAYTCAVSPAKRKGKPSGTPRRRRGVKLRPTELAPGELALADPPAALAALEEEVRADGGAVLARYREPLGGHPLLLVALPLQLVAPTPFQRDISDAHVRKLTHAMDKTKRFLDPVVAVRDRRAEEGDAQARYWVPNGFHRLTALKELGAKTILALLVPEREVAYQILALNIEKPHNLREKSLGVVRLYRELVRLGTGENEEHYALELEEPALITLGFAYEKRPRLSAGAYHPALRKTDQWVGGALAKAARERERLADDLLSLDDAVTSVVLRLKERGLQSPYLRAFVVARINPLRFMKGTAPPVGELIATMTKRARGMDPERIRSEDVARSGGAAPEATDS
jgi:ParB family transcriptional regulator, chromosome partitioning protein